MKKSKTPGFFIERHQTRIALKKARIEQEHLKALDGIQFFKNRIRELRRAHGFMATLFNAVVRSMIDRFKLAIAKLRQRCRDLVDDLNRVPLFVTDH